MSDAETASAAPVVIVVGSTMMDMIAYVDRVPAAGETLHGNRFSLGFGGKGANQAVMARRLGATVALANCVGDDVFADMTIDNLAAEGVDVGHVRRVPGVGTGVAPIWVEPDGTNRIIIIAGANGRVDEEHAREAVGAAPRVDVVLGQFEVPQRATAAAFAMARQRGAATILNPAPAADIASDLLQVTDWLVPNDIEFEFLASVVGVRVQNGTRDEAMSHVANELGVRMVVTLGEHGAAVVDSGSVVHVPAPRANVVDTTGAGDAFVGAFAYAVAAGRAIRDAVQLGCACASASVARPGTQVSFPSGPEAALRAR